jgi:DNA-binding NarL/FixJ family response regulator
VVRKGLRALLDREPGVEVAGEADDGEQAIRAADRLRPDVVLMDLAILRKLQLASRTQAALYALREGIATLEEAPPT